VKIILQVEDDPNDVIFLRHAMDKAGAINPIHTVSDGRQAIAYLQGTGKYADRAKFPFPCLVLLDLKLPYVMGLEVLKWIRNHSPTALPVVMMTASADDADIATAYRLGASAFLSKPSEAAQLEDMAKAIQHFWLKHNTLPVASAAGPVMEEMIARVQHAVPAAG